MLPPLREKPLGEKGETAPQQHTRTCVSRVGTKALRPRWFPKTAPLGDENGHLRAPFPRPNGRTFVPGSDRHRRSNCPHFGMVADEQRRRHDALLGASEQSNRYEYDHFQATLNLQSCLVRARLCPGFTGLFWARGCISRSNSSASASQRSCSIRLRCLGVGKLHDVLQLPDCFLLLVLRQRLAPHTP